MSHSDFRKLNEQEMVQVDKAIERLGKFKLKERGLQHSAACECLVCYLQSQNFVVCLIKDGAGIQAGVAKRNPIDPENEGVGKTIALHRAVRSKRLAL